MMGKSSDFRFWEEKLPLDLRSCGDEAQLQVQNDDEDQVGACSPPLWTRAPIHFRHETTPLLPNKNHHYSCPSPTSRLRAIVDGRRELMEMIKNMPESSYELSLKDIVDDDQRNMEEVQEKKVKHKTDDRIPQKSKKTKLSQICRSESMESEVFLLKMFLPVSLSFKKKPNARKQSKVSPGQSSEGGCDNKASKNWWKMIFLAVKDNNSRRISRTTSDTSSNRTSLVENSLIPCRWSFSKKKCKSGGQRGCLF